MQLRFYFVLLLFLSSLQAFAQSAIYHRATIRLEGKQLRDLAALGIETDHGQLVSGRHLTSDFSEEELERVAAAGFLYTIDIPNVVDYYQNRRFYLHNSENNSRGGGDYPCPSGNQPQAGSYSDPVHFGLGSMAGFYTYQELLDILDQMRLLYPNLITERAPIGGANLTHDGNPVYWLRISDNADTDESAEPQVLYTALHHAREPNSLTLLIYYMWYLLENYETDPEVRFLLDNTALYFVPCLNPDGYIYNQTIAPEGGGLWRKNRRPGQNGGAVTGVDLNRNYGYEWGFDDEGSSGNQNSETYRGPSAFSEPETQAIRQFCNEHAFQVALNYHTFGNLLIYPWGYSDSPTVDAPTFNTLAKTFTLENNFLAGTGTETVGYVVNGDSDDWMYGETTSKPAIFSMTPEVGSEFWPSIEEIIPNCQASMWMNLAAANTPHVAGYAALNQTYREIDPENPALHFTLQRFGLQDGALSVSAYSLQPALIQPVAGSLSFQLDDNETVDDNIALELINPIQAGTQLGFVLLVDNGHFIRTDTVYLPMGGFEDSAVFDEGFEQLNGWTNTGSWALTDEDFTSAPNSLTDSPYNEYGNNAFYEITMDEPITLGEADQYRLLFNAKWHIETYYDWAQLQFQVNDGAWIPACGRYTIPGSILQADNEPIWEGLNSEWLEEEIVLTDYVQSGDQIRLRFLLASDEFLTFDGFYVDDLVLQQRSNATVSTTLLSPDQFSISVHPNPATQVLRGQVVLPKGETGNLQWQLHDSRGQLVRAGVLYAIQNAHRWDINIAELAPGIYWLHGKTDSGVIPAQKVIIIR